MKRLLHSRLVTIEVGKYQFRPGILPTVLTLCLLYIMISLGFWQLDRAAFKQDLQNRIEQRRNLPPVGLEELPADTEQAVFYPVRLRGRFDVEHQFLLDNRILKQRAGYHVYTPLLLADGRTLLVNRGWVAQGRTRQDLPDLPAPEGTVEFTGLMDKPPSKGVILMDRANDSQQWPRVLQYIDLQEIGDATGADLYPMIVWLDPGTGFGFDYQLPVLSLNSARNTGYAFQWFSMSVALAIIYIVVNTRRIQQKNND